MRLSAPAIVFSLCAVLAATSPVPGTFNPQPDPPLAFNPQPDPPREFNPQPDPPVWDPTKVYIDQISYAGSGCKAGSVAILGSQNWTVVTLAFDNYIASIGPGIPFAERRKNCLINFRIHHPQGYSYTPYKTDCIGRTELENEVRATQESTYWFSGYPPPPRSPYSSHWTGPKSENYHASDTLTGSTWSPCNASASLNVNTQVFLDNSLNPKGSGLITTDGTGHKVGTIFGIDWKKCP